MKEPKKDAFDLWWERAEKPVNSMLMIQAEINEAVMALLPEQRRDRTTVNNAVRKRPIEGAMMTKPGRDADGISVDHNDHSRGGIAALSPIDQTARRHTARLHAHD
jgi:hypothetical protein